VRSVVVARATRTLLGLTLVATLVLPAHALAADPAPLVTGVATVGFTVSGMDRSTEFFTKVLTFEKVSDVEVTGEAYEHLTGVFGARARIVRMRLGDETIELTEYLAPRGRAVPEDARSNDRSFQHVAIIVSDMAKAYARLREFNVRHASSGPQRLPDWNPAAGGIEAFYFKDPDGHALEILAFPEGKGAAKWHRKTDALFLGIDHTAIVVADTEASLGFYRDVLGLAVAGHSENYGTEQEHLNNVFGARLRITALRGTRGPGVELLEYLTPRDGKPYPGDLRANDLAYWQSTLTAAGSLEADVTRLFATHALFVSPGAVGVDGTGLDFSAGLVVRDPDGHAVRIVGERAPVAAGTGR
jgi:catechol 2,3-dioxygenase-like lactoylglutathione lyase family enzyme